MALPDVQRKVLEDSIRAALGGGGAGARGSAPVDEAPRIELKTFG